MIFVGILGGHQLKRKRFDLISCKTFALVHIETCSPQFLWLFFYLCVHVPCSVHCLLLLFLFCMYLPSLAKKNHNFRLMIKNVLHFQNQSIIPQKYQNLFKIPPNDKTDLGLKEPSSGIGFVILLNFE